MAGVPSRIHLYHIVHEDKLASIATDGFLWSYEKAMARGSPGTTVGMAKIKRRRMDSTLRSHPSLNVGSCAPFYFCPRSIMLFLLHKGNHPELDYRGGQDSIVHLVFDMDAVIAWAEAEGLRWAFTLSNAGSGYFEDRNERSELEDVDWNAVRARNWRDGHVRERKQAEFLVENRVPWSLVKGIGVRTDTIGRRVAQSVASASYRPKVVPRPHWYY